MGHAVVSVAHGAALAAVVVAIVNLPGRWRWLGLCVTLPTWIVVALLDYRGVRSALPHGLWEPRIAAISALACRAKHQTLVDKPALEVVSGNATIDISPVGERATIRGEYILKNTHPQAIGYLDVVLDPKAAAVLTLEGMPGELPIDSIYGTSHVDFARPMQSGDERRLSFVLVFERSFTRRETGGLGGSVALPSGETWPGSDWLPTVGVGPCDQLFSTVKTNREWNKMTGGVSGPGIRGLSSIRRPRLRPAHVRV